MTSKTMKIGRPRQIYEGDLNNKFIPIEERKTNENNKIKVPKKSDFYNVPYL